MLRAWGWTGVQARHGAVWLEGVTGHSLVCGWGGGPQGAGGSRGPLALVRTGVRTPFRPSLTPRLCPSLQRARAPRAGPGGHPAGPRRGRRPPARSRRRTGPCSPATAPPSAPGRSRPTGSPTRPTASEARPLVPATSPSAHVIKCPGKPLSRVVTLPREAPGSWGRAWGATRRVTVLGPVRPHPRLSAPAHLLTLHPPHAPHARRLHRLRVGGQTSDSSWERGGLLATRTLGVVRPRVTGPGALGQGRSQALRPRVCVQEPLSLPPRGRGRRGGRGSLSVSS